MNKKMPELLAPAGSMDALKAAVNAGANAVYLAGKHFGARHYAANFNDKELDEAVDFAHERGVKVYVTVNTLIKDHEIKEVSKYLIFLYKIGVDAVLVQDMGVISLIKKLVPEREIHASTQMTIHNLEGVEWASEMGIKRVVLSREMGLSEIKKISQNIKDKEIELEIFAHGALCYSYSGQCFISSFIGGRSGNRGMCAQPCRRKYDLVFGKKDEYGKPVKLASANIKDPYLLSTRDLALYKHLDKIIELNISSLKIEGRMRSPEYVAIVVSTYRNALDSIAKGRWKSKKEDINNLKLAFSRDFTGGYLLEPNSSHVMGRNLPGNRGIYVGHVLKYNRNNKEVLLEIKGNIVPHKGDGIVFISPNKSIKDYGMLVTENPQITKNKVKFKVQRHLNPGTKLYLTKSKKLIDKAQKIINGTTDELKNQIIIDLDILIENNGIIFIKSSFKGNEGYINIEKIADYKMEKAVNKPISKETIAKQFKKTGNTSFKIKNINITYPGGLFAPISQLNQIRRELFEEISSKIISSYKPTQEKVEASYKHFNDLKHELDKSSDIKQNNKIPLLCAYVDNLDVVKAAAEQGCKRIYFNPFNFYNPVKCNAKSENKNEDYLKLIIKAFSICKENDVEFVLKLPNITPTYFLNNIRNLLIDSFKEGIAGVMVNGIGAAKFIQDINPKINLFPASGSNITNSESIDLLKGYFKTFTISPEVSKDEIKNLSLEVQKKKLDVHLELIVHGNLESIVSKDCLTCLIDTNLTEKSQNDLFFAIKDIKDHIFPLRLDNECRTVILNSVELCLIDYLNQIMKMNIDAVALDLQGRSRIYAQEICSIYKNMVEISINKPPQKNKLKRAKEKIKKMSLGGITTGNFIKGTTK